MTRRHLAWAALAALGLSPQIASAVRPVRPAGAPEVPDAGPPPEPPPPKPIQDHTVPDPSLHPTPGPTKPVPAPVKPPPEPKKIENPAEVTYRQNSGEHAFSLRVRPGAPRPGETVELVFDIAVIHDPPDAVQGDREALRDADLVVTLEKGKVGPAHQLHPLGNPGQYGAHLLATESGLFTVRVGRRSGKPGVDAAFPLGIGVATPVRPDDVQATLNPTARGPVKAQDALPATANGLSLPETMRALGERFLQLDAQLESGKGDASGLARAMVELGKGVSGTTPPFARNRPREFEVETNRLQTALAGLATAPTKQKLSDLEQNVCFRCHAQFRFGVAADVTRWPAFTLAKEEK
jgi:hypothetical protein